MMHYVVIGLMGLLKDLSVGIVCLWTTIDNFRQLLYLYLQREEEEESGDQEKSEWEKRLQFVCFMHMTDINILAVSYYPSKNTCRVTSDFDIFLGLGSLHISECYLDHHLDAVFLLPTSFIVQVNEHVPDLQLLH